MSEKRLIDANALLEDLGFPEDDRDRLINLIIDRAPTIDAVEVVRCRDCLWAQERYGHLECIHGVNYRNTWNSPDFFCAQGSRKEG